MLLKTSPNGVKGRLSRRGAAVKNLSHSWFLRRSQYNAPRFPKTRQLLSLLTDIRTDVNYALHLPKKSIHPIRI